MVELSVVLPAHNEQATIEQVVYEVHDVLDQSGVASEIIVVNDGSVDRTGQILHALAKTISMVRLIEHHSGRGYGGGGSRHFLRHQALPDPHRELGLPRDVSGGRLLRRLRV